MKRHKKDTVLILELQAAKKRRLCLNDFFSEGTDIVCDFNKGVPVKNDSVSKVYSVGLFERVENPVFLFQELYRICVNNAELEITVPYYSCSEAFANPLNRNFFTEGSFRYFTGDKWYGSDYGFNVTFDIVRIDYNYTRFGKMMPFKKYARRYFMNVVNRICVKLRAVK